MRFSLIIPTIIIGIVIGLFPSASQAGVYSVSGTQWEFCKEPIPFYINLPTVPDPSPGATGTLTIQTRGDIDDDDVEYIHFYIDGIDLGILYNGQPFDDMFDNTPFDSGAQYPGTTTYSATLSNTNLLSIVADDIAIVTVQRRTNVNDIDWASDEFVTATLEYVPEPMSLLLMAVGGLMILRIKRSR
ncbi:MAG: PEP-CTERM sorting domain-containing protein [Planctomycetota bacterium]|jgi:hypothetical protein